MIVLAGTIGAGKSSLTEMMAEHFDSQAFYESIDDNEVLPLFYANPEQYAFLLQIYFLNKRFASIKQAMKDDNNVLDRSIYEDSKRGRSYEQLSFDPSLYDYYKELNRRYDQWYEEYKESPKIQIDGDRYNFVEDPQAKEEVLKMIEEKLAEIRQTELAI